MILTQKSLQTRSVCYIVCAIIYKSMHGYRVKINDDSPESTR